MNRLLLRQIKRNLGGVDQIPEEMMPLIKAINQSYDHNEKDRQLLIRSMDISSEELASANAKLYEESELKTKSLNQLKRAVVTLTANNDLLEFKDADSLSILEISELIEDLSHKIRETEDNLFKVNKELNEFAYVVSHDLKAPLRSIGSLSDWLATDYEDKLDDQGKEYLTLLRKRVKRLHKLIEGVLEYSRIGRTETKRVSVDLNGLLSEVVDMLEAEEFVEIDQLPTIQADETQIRQVFQNLISNGIKHNDKEKPLINIACKNGGNKYTFSVSDNGNGVDPKYFERIFKIFQTLRSKDKTDSTGVGLTVVKRIVNSYGGEIWLESEPEKGTSFFFTFPKTST